MINQEIAKLSNEQYSIDTLIDSLDDFLRYENILSHHARDLLELQGVAMDTYSKILGKRIALLEDA